MGKGILLVTIKDLMQVLKQSGWKIRNGGWPKVNYCEDRYDFAYSQKTLFPLNQAAASALKEIA